MMSNYIILQLRRYGYLPIFSFTSGNYFSSLQENFGEKKFRLNLMQPSKDLFRKLLTKKYSFTFPLWCLDGQSCSINKDWVLTMFGMLRNHSLEILFFWMFFSLFSSVWLSIVSPISSTECCIWNIFGHSMKITITISIRTHSPAMRHLHLRLLLHLFQLVIKKKKKINITNLRFNKEINLFWKYYLSPLE